MNRQLVLAIVVLVGSLCPAHAKLDNKPERLEWLQDAGFGMFIHWSLDSQIGSVISHSMAGASDDYLDWFINELPKTFVPKRWDPDEIARLAKLTGVQYVVLTAKHHSGFCLWDTETTDFKITNTPYSKDILPDYCRALREQGIQVGLYYSPEDFAWLHRHWHPVKRRHPGLLDPDKDPAYKDFVRRQVTELFSNYGPIDVLFIDGIGMEITKEVCWTLQPALQVPPYAETGKATAQAQGTVILEGQLLEMAGAAEVVVGFEFQEYLGFAEAMYNTVWTAAATQTRSAPGAFRITVEGLKPGVEYQYRAVVKHPQLIVRGDHLRIRAK